jgi:hypothetical protein
VEVPVTRTVLHPESGVTTTCPAKGIHNVLIADIAVDQEPELLFRHRSPLCPSRPERSPLAVTCDVMHLGS